MITSKEVSGMCYSLALIVCFVIARSGSDEAIQLARVAMDCFASLAMMGWTAPNGISVPDW